MITISQPTEHQLGSVRAWWVRALVGRQASGWEAFGRCRVTGFLALIAARALVDALLLESRVLVACLDVVPGEAVGFVAWSPATDEQPLQLHMVHVLGPDKPVGARRLGVGLKLLRAAVGDAGHYRATCETQAGRCLLDAFRGRTFKPVLTITTQGSNVEHITDGVVVHNGRMLMAYPAADVSACTVEVGDLDLRDLRPPQDPDAQLHAFLAKAGRVDFKADAVFKGTDAWLPSEPVNAFGLDRAPVVVCMEPNCTASPLPVGGVCRDHIPEVDA